MTDIDLERRRLLRRAGGTSALTMLAPALWLTGGGISSSRAAAPNTPGAFDVDLRLRAHRDTVPILPGKPSEVWRYTGERLAGPEDTLTSLGESYPGPLIRLRRGQRFRARLENDLPEDTTVHWHGLHVPPDVDGQPRLPIRPGQFMEVAFDVVDRAGLYWYHPHPHGPHGGRVGFQSVAGLAGPLIIEDDAERALGLPDGDRELVLVLQDRSFTGDNELRYIGSGMGSMMTRMMGFRGERLLVNGRPDARREVFAQPHRLRLLNGSNSRIYKLAWSDGRPVTVIGTGGGLLAAPGERPFVTLAPAQRIDLWVDFSGDDPGRTVQLVSQAHEGGMTDGGMMSDGMMSDGMMSDGMMSDGMMGGGMMGGGMMGRMMGSEHLPLVTFDVVRQARGSQRLPARLATDLPEPDVSADTPVRRFELGMRMMQGFTLNGRRMSGTSVADDEVVRLGRTEIWELFNDTMMPHPMHIHGLQFRILERAPNRDPGDLHAGVVDAGLHDTVLVFPGERVRLALKFEDFTGLYMYHCHNMEHEDNGMMRYYRVET